MLAAQERGRQLIVTTLRMPTSGGMSDLTAWLSGDLGPSAVRLYSNPVLYDKSNTLAMYTESAFPGYAPVIGAGWSAPFVNASGDAESDTPQLFFQYAGTSGTATVHGLYVTDSANTKLLLVAEFVAPIVLSVDNPVIDPVLQLTDLSQF